MNGFEYYLPRPPTVPLALNAAGELQLSNVTKLNNAKPARNRPTK
jgi:hypothetical protein